MLVNWKAVQFGLFRVTKPGTMNPLSHGVWQLLVRFVLFSIASLNGATSLDSLPLDIWLLFLVALVKSAHSIKISQYIWWVIRVARIAPLTNPSDLVVGAPVDPQNETVQGGETRMQRTCCSIASPPVPVWLVNGQPGPRGPGTMVAAERELLSWSWSSGVHRTYRTCGKSWCRAWSEATGPDWQIPWRSGRRFWTPCGR